MLPEECKKEIMDYLTLKDWIYPHSVKLFDNSNTSFLSTIIIYSKNGVKKNMENKFEKNKINMSKYFLEYIGHFLRKYKIETVNFFHSEQITYTSKSWKFKEIKESIVL